MKGTYVRLVARPADDRGDDIVFEVCAKRVLVFKLTDEGVIFLDETTIKEIKIGAFAYRWVYKDRKPVHFEQALRLIPRFAHWTSYQPDF